MANELNLSASLSFSKSGAMVDKALTASLTVTGDAFSHEVQSIGTTEEELAQGADLGTPGYMLVKNLDAANYVEIGHATSSYAIKLKAGEFALYRHNSATIYAKSNTAACNIEYILIED